MVKTPKKVRYIKKERKLAREMGCLKQRTIELAAEIGVHERTIKRWDREKRA